MAEWNGIWEAMTASRGEAEKSLKGRELGVVLGMGEELTSVLEELQLMERKIDEKGVGSPDPLFRDWFKGIIDRFHATAGAGPGAGMGKPAYDLLNGVWDCGIVAITSFLERKARTVGVMSWTIGVSVGFPSGVSANLQVTFARE